ncbi:MAG: hypothetical protein OTJ97_03300 [SAR202 cluster bacterium]|nr:hypothetical protein [SAR202 cluster bacterium]
MSSEAPSRQNLTWLGIFILVGVPGIALRLSGTHFDPIVAAIVFGIGIVGGAFLLSWAAEVAQVGISASLAIAVLALIAILPEYTIEAILDWKAGAPFDPALGLVTPEMELVAANVTGSSRLLVGLGWPVVILIFWAKRREILDLRGQVSLELMMLIVATVLTFLMFFMGQLHIALAILLVALYLLYLAISSTKESGEPELIGVAAMIGAMSPPRRRTAVVGLLAFAEIVLLAPKMIGWRAGAVLFGLFLVHLLFPNEEARRAFTYVYLVLTVTLIVWNWRQLPALGGRPGLGIGDRD